ncbi:MAG TPA: MarR family winged helix-turn-helix transcriptional regulator [Acidimicrobiales bacterium]
MDTSPPVDVVSGVFMLARELRREIGELMAHEPWAIDAGFRPPCLGVMSVVAKMGPVSQRAISDRLGLDASDVVGVLDILETAGMVERRRDPDDRRRHAVVLTEAGHQASQRLSVLRSQVEAKVLAGLEPDERRQLADLLDRALNARQSSPA